MGAEAHLTRLGLEDWVTTQRRRRWRWAARVAREPHKWSHGILIWHPGDQHDHRPHRPPQRPKTRWSDDITAHYYSASGSQSTDHNGNIPWIEVATTAAWTSWELSFVSPSATNCTT